MEKMYYAVSYQNPGVNYHDKGIMVKIFKENELDFAKEYVKKGEENMDNTELFTREQAIAKFGLSAIENAEHNYLNPTPNKFVDEDDEFDTVQDSENWVKMTARPKAYGIEKLD